MIYAVIVAGGDLVAAVYIVDFEYIMFGEDFRFFVDFMRVGELIYVIVGTIDVVIVV